MHWAERELVKLLKYQNNTAIVRIELLQQQIRSKDTEVRRRSRELQSTSLRASRIPCIPANPIFKLVLNLVYAQIFKDRIS